MLGNGAFGMYEFPATASRKRLICFWNTYLHLLIIISDENAENSVFLFYCKQGKEKIHWNS